MSMIKAATAVLGHSDFVIINEDQIALDVFLPHDPDDEDALPRREFVTGEQLAAIHALAADLDAEAALQAKHDAINAERSRRILVGVTVDVAGIGPIPLQGRPEDQINMMALADTARDLQAAGITAPVIPFRDGANAEHMMTAAQMLEANNKGKQWVSAVYQASWAIKAMEPLPDDVTADELWPA